MFSIWTLDFREEIELHHWLLVYQIIKLTVTFLKCTYSLLDEATFCLHWRHVDATYVKILIYSIYDLY